MAEGDHGAKLADRSAGISSGAARPSSGVAAFVRDVAFRDLRHRGVAVAARVAVIGGPVLLRRHHAITVAGALAQQDDSIVVRGNLKVGGAFIEDAALQSPAIGGLDFLSRDDGHDRRPLRQSYTDRTDNEKTKNERSHAGKISGLKPIYDPFQGFDIARMIRPAVRGCYRLAGTALRLYAEHTRHGD